MRLAVAPVFWLPGALGFAEELYTTNIVCRPRNCINPITPALDDIPKLEELRWIKANKNEVVPMTTFCRNIVDYDPGLPARDPTELSSSGSPLVDIVIAQDNAAMRMYFLHLSGMGIEAWDHATPFGRDDLVSPLRDCVRTVAKMACFTYFPLADWRLPNGSTTRYLRPCKSSCQNYLSECSVQCCDEGVKCVFDHQTELSNGTILTQTGYVDALGPSETCTGGAASRAATLFIVMLIGLFGLDAVA